MTFAFSARTLLQHVLFVFLLVIAPTWDYRYTSRLKREPSSQRKIGVYKTLCAWLWIASFVAVLAVGWQPLFNINPAPGEIDWLHVAWIRYLIEAVLALFVAGALLPYVTAAWKKLTNRPRKYGSAEALKSMTWFLPVTWSERRWFAVASITAGICEEILFRGFLLRYLHFFPWHVGLTLALFISAVIFGVQHLYQGTGGTVGSGVIGLLLSLLFLLTGNLLAPMILHAVLDLRMLVILRPPNAIDAVPA